MNQKKLVKEIDIAIAISDYLKNSTYYYDFAPNFSIDRSSNKNELNMYLKASATILCKKKNWIIVNEFGDKIKFTKIIYSRNKERYVDGCVYETWLIVLQSEFQKIVSTFEYNCSNDAPLRRSGLILSDINDLQKSDDTNIPWDLF